MTSTLPKSGRGSGGELGPLIRDLLRRNLKCRHRHDAIATGLYYIPEGCNCFPDPIQALCEQHFITCHSTGPIETIARILA
jgi:hypothetical protein